MYVFSPISLYLSLYSNTHHLLFSREKKPNFQHEFEKISKNQGSGDLVAVPWERDNYGGGVYRSPGKGEKCNNAVIIMKNKDK